MSQHHERATAFVNRLISNPSLKQYTPLQKEEQVQQFLLGNMRQLAPTLQSPAFFPGMELGKIQDLLNTVLIQLTNERLLPALKGIIQKIDFAFVQFLRQQQTRPSNIQDQVLRYLNQILSKPEVRSAFSGAYTALHYDFSSKYINEAFRMHRHIFFDFTKVQRLKMSKEEIKSYVEVSLLLKAIVKASSSTEEILDDGRSGLISVSYAQSLVEKLQKELSLLPPEVISSAVHASVSFQENPQVEATARIANILASRGKNFMPNIKVDRGADSPDKSWLNIARRNYKFYGFDIKMLDEMYMIAAENGW